MRGHSEYLDVSEVVCVKSDSETYCKQCSITPFHSSEFEGAVNHLISAHGYRILHVGQETELKRETPIHKTVAVLGR